MAAITIVQGSPKKSATIKNHHQIILRLEFSPILITK